MQIAQPEYFHQLAKKVNMLRHHVWFGIMRPSSLGGGRILRRTLSVCLSVRPIIERHVAPPSELQ